MRQVANEMRKAYGPSYVVEQLLSYAEAINGENSVVESIRAIGEAEHLRMHNALLWGVDADRKIRYERVLKRYSETDKVDFKTFCEHEDRELQGTEEWDMNVIGVMKIADHIFYNNGTVEELFLQIG